MTLIVRPGQTVGDPYFSNVTLLLKGEGASIVDSSPSPKTITAFGSTATSTTQKKFGDKSIVFDGSGDYLTLSGGAALPAGSEDFTVELWAYNAAANWTRATYFLENTVTNGFQFWISSAGNLVIGRFGIDQQVSGSVTGLALNAWHHFASVRSGSNFNIYVNGSSIGSAPSTPVYASSFTDQRVSNTGSNAWNGYIDDLRITKGIARYTADFTAPTEAFPDAQY